MKERVEEKGGKKENALNAGDQNIVCEALAFLSRSQRGMLERT
jgi:hypothetical protein